MSLWWKISFEFFLLRHRRSLWRKVFDETFVIISLTDDLHQYALFSSSVELAVEDPLPRAEVQPSVRYGDNDFTAHDLPFHVGVGIVFTGIVAVLGHRLMGRQLFEPYVIVVVEPGLIIVNEDGSRDMHRIAEDEAFPDAAVPQTFFHLGCNIDECPPGRHGKPEFLPIAFHCSFPPIQRGFDSFIRCSILLYRNQHNLSFVWLFVLLIPLCPVHPV